MLTIKLLKILPSTVLSILGVIGIVGIAVANRAIFINLLDEWQVLPRQQPYSELYFADEQHLPRVARQDATQEVMFTVHNVEYRTTIYRYTVAAISGSSSRLLRSGTVTLNHDQSTTVEDTIKIPAIGERVAIRVELEHSGTAPDSRLSGLQRQSIAYWMKVVRL